MNILTRNLRIIKATTNGSSPASVLFDNLRQSMYRSAISLETLYPHSTLKLTTPTKPTESMNDKFSGYIPIDQVELTFSRSTGPGGQNVNKVNTKVDLRVHLETANWLHEDIKKKLLETQKNKISKDGYLIFRSELTRNQQLNVADCLEKLRSLIRDVCFEAAPKSEETLEKLRKRRETANRQRLYLKREISSTKSNRQSPNVRDLL